jgi:hypothetical protein
MTELNPEVFSDAQLTTVIAALGRAATARGLLPAPALNDDALPPEPAIVPPAESRAWRVLWATARAAPYYN